jgi:hypothetical protein
MKEVERIKVLAAVSGSLWNFYFEVLIYHLVTDFLRERHQPSCSFFASLCKAIPEAYASIHPWLPQEQSGPSRDTTR